MYMIQQNKVAKRTASGMTGQLSTPVMVALAGTLLAATMVFEVSELAVALIGAGIYQLYRILFRPSPKTAKGAKVEPATPPASKATEKSTRLPRVTRGQRLEQKVSGLSKKDEPDYRQASAKPVLAPTFISTGFEAQVQELLVQLTPTTEAEAVVQRLAHMVRKALSPMIPDVEVTGFASGNPTISKAFGVAVPEVDIVISASPAVLARALQPRLTKGGAAAVRADPRKLQKSAIRACTDELVTAGLKFRRSAFRGDDPKVTMLAPTSLTGTTLQIPLDVSVNSATPLHSAVLLTECGKLEPRAKELILLVKRWARDRGISHAAKGHLNPYGWTLLSIYFLQVGAKLLPSLKEFKRSAALAGAVGSEQKWSPQTEGADGISTATLFKEFIHFYHAEFGWRDEAISVRVAQRSTPALALPIHIVESADASTTSAAPSIEDPFDVKRNIAVCMTALGVSRMHEELLRAEEFFGQLGSECSLAALLEPWTPPERDAAHPAEEETGCAVDE